MWDKVRLAEAPGCVADVYLVPCNDDNYGYLVVDRKTQEAAAVDAADPAAFQQLISEKKVELKYVLTTHHHPDHSQGNGGMRKAFPNAAIIGSHFGTTPEATEQMSPYAIKQLGSVKFTAIATPGHTADHLCFFFEANDQSANENQRPFLFTGDFLFVAGCGQFFEGTPQEVGDGIDELFNNYSEETYMFPGHEYTLNNLKFAHSVDPQNEAITKKIAQVQAQGPPTVPSTLQQELDCNPFVWCVRCPEKLGEEMNQEYSDKYEMLAATRTNKNRFKPV